MSYSNVPLSGQTLGNTRVPINTNFSLIQTAISANHIAIGASGAGKHNFCQFPEQSSAPATAVNEGGIYTKVGTNPAQTNLFFRGENNGFEYRLTTAISASTARFGNNTNYSGNNNGGWTFLPGGLILQYGFLTSPVSGNNTITFPISFSTVINISVTVRSQIDIGHVVNTVTTTDFVCRLTAAPTGTNRRIYWTAIGVPS